MARLRLLIGLLLLVSAVDAMAARLTFDHYHPQSVINRHLRELAAAHPDLVTFAVLGHSSEGREINYVALSSAPLGTRPALYVNGAHHGNEKSSTETVLGLIETLLERRSDADVAALLGRYAIYLQPIVNADGHARHTRYDSEGRDPNRDYAFPGQKSGEAFRLPETRLVRDLLAREQFRAAIALHSGMKGVLWPWCWTAAPNPEQNLFANLARIAANALGSSYYRQSYHDYSATGEFIDYAYMAHGTMAVTIEVSRHAAPRLPRLKSVVSRAVASSLAFLKTIMQIDQGELELVGTELARPTAPRTMAVH